MKKFQSVLIAVLVSGCAGQSIQNNSSNQKFGCYEGYGKSYKQGIIENEVSRLRCFLELGQSESVGKQIEYISALKKEQKLAEKHEILLTQYKQAATGPIVETLNGDYWIIKNSFPDYVFDERYEKGTILIEFDISKAGIPINLEVLNSDSEMYVSPSVRAIRKLRYLPKIVDGEAYEVPGVRVVYTFSKL